MNPRPGTRLHPNSPRKRHRKSRRPRAEGRPLCVQGRQDGKTAMSSRIDGIKSRNDFAAEMGSLSGLVRSDGQRPGTPMEKLDTSQTLLRVRLMDFGSLTKPEVLLLVLIATGAGFFIVSATLDPVTLFNALVGTALFARGTAALNHY